VNFLSKIGYIEGTLLGGVGITPAGMIVYEAAITEPDKASEAFPPINVIYAGNITNSTIQQAGNSSAQDATVDGAKTATPAED
jgi:hypothetical protein